jgi:hypothetical protein
MVNEGTKNKAVVTQLTKKYGIRRIEISVYHPQTNLMERGHQAIKDSLSKLANAEIGNWLRNLHACLWADRITVRITTEVSSFRFNYGYKPIILIKEDVLSWSFLAWKDVKITVKLLALRTL